MGGRGAYAAVGAQVAPLSNCSVAGTRACMGIRPESAMAMKIAEDGRHQPKDGSTTPVKPTNACVALRVGIALLRGNEPSQTKKPRKHWVCGALTGPMRTLANISLAESQSVGPLGFMRLTEAFYERSPNDSPNTQKHQ